ncbi:hypothetical protein RND71_028384 [Anisodus tanguticus]|uniref:Uncharacterized protein n=1 Tax=Anisodus tanguticus TaxID=243964 RepID=A0AAE1RKU0_9SOLA|nr:hypothetical protein RND71_028384 [Anisodus tanguticus]
MRPQLMRTHHRDIWEQVHALGPQFVFQDPGECNINLVREAYANWRCTLVVSSEPFEEIYSHLPYHELRHLLCGQHSTARWEHNKKYGTHKTFPFSHMTQKASCNEKVDEKGSCRSGLQFFFGSIFTRYFRHHEVFEEEVDYRLQDFVELIDDDVPIPESEPHVEPSSKEEADTDA